MEYDTLKAFRLCPLLNDSGISSIFELYFIISLLLIEKVNLINYFVFLTIYQSILLLYLHLSLKSCLILTCVYFINSEKGRYPTWIQAYNVSNGARVWEPFNSTMMKSFICVKSKKVLSFYLTFYIKVSVLCIFLQ